MVSLRFKRLFASALTLALGTYTLNLVATANTVSTVGNTASAAANTANAASSNASSATSSTAAGAEENVEALPPDGEEPEAKATIRVRISVPQMKGNTQKITAFPYITKPLKVTKVIEPLPEEDKELKELIIAAGYVSRQSLTKPYPDVNWRWQYAYRNALKRAGGYEPKFVPGIYRWANNMIKYVKPECERINRIEAARNKRYQDTVVEFDDNHKDEEMEALRLGKEPVAVPLKSVYHGTATEGDVTLSPGEWYLTGTHKVPGLTYYWQEKVKLNPRDRVVVTLNDANAILIQGGW
jgi:hypothetical protein